MDSLRVVTEPGLEACTALELERLGLSFEHAGSGFLLLEGGLEDLYRANLRIATASRVLLELGAFRAAAFSELRKKASRLSWERCLSPGQPVVFRVACRGSRLYHTRGVAERVAGAIADRLGEAPGPPGAASEDAPGAAQIVFVRIEADECSIGVDSSGEPLHRRGYRLAVAKAPLRETLAAAVLLASGWDAAAPLVDPFCGSGTIAVEAARMALGIPPGRDRRFAFMGWPGFDAGRWSSLLAGAGARPSSGAPIIMGSDRDAGAVRMAEANAKRAAVAGSIRFSRRAVSDLEPPGGPGFVVTNPPYGVRTASGRDLRDLYARLGDVLRERCPGWRAAVLCSDARLLDQTGLRLEPALAFANGGIRVRLACGVVPG